MDAEDAQEARTIGWRLWQVRDDRGKSLRVIAELAGMSATTLWRIEQGRRSVTLSELRALANALQIPPGELTRLPVPAPANGETDSAIQAIHLAVVRPAATGRMVEYSRWTRCAPGSPRRWTRTAGAIASVRSVPRCRV